MCGESACEWQRWAAGRMGMAVTAPAAGQPFARPQPQPQPPEGEDKSKQLNALLSNFGRADGDVLLPGCTSDAPAATAGRLIDEAATAHQYKQMG